MKYIFKLRKSSLFSVPNPARGAYSGPSGLEDWSAHPHPRQISA